MERGDLDSAGAKAIIAELNALIRELKDQKLETSSWYGKLAGEKDAFERINRGYNYSRLEEAVDDDNFPWFLYWEIVWITVHSDFCKGQTVLDLGGCSSLFSYYLASKRTGGDRRRFAAGISSKCEPRGTAHGLESQYL